MGNSSAASTCGIVATASWLSVANSLTCSRFGRRSSIFSLALAKVLAAVDLTSAKAGAHPRVGPGLPRGDGINIERLMLMPAGPFPVLAHP